MRPCAVHQTRVVFALKTSPPQVSNVSSRANYYSLYFTTFSYTPRRDREQHRVSAVSHARLWRGVDDDRSSVSRLWGVDKPLGDVPAGRPSNPRQSESHFREEREEIDQQTKRLSFVRFDLILRYVSVCLDGPHKIAQNVLICLFCNLYIIPKPRDWNLAMIFRRDEMICSLLSNVMTQWKHHLLNTSKTN